MGHGFVPMMGAVDSFSRLQAPPSLKSMLTVPPAAAAAAPAVPGIFTSHGQIKGLIQAGGFPGAGGQHVQSHIHHNRSVVQPAQGASVIKGLIQAGGIPGVPPGGRLRVPSQQWR